MPTENISLVSTSQPAASLMAESANSASSNSAAGLDSSSASFEKILSNETNTLDTSSNNPSQAIAEKPCIAQFMVMTGCDFSTASKALYQYGNWQDYIKSDATIPDLSNAQAQLSNEVSAGTRSLADGTYGQRNDYVKPDPFTTDTPGKVVPAFDEQGKVSGLGLVTNTGEQKTVVSLTDRNTILEATDGFHIGRQALDCFAQKVTGDATSTFANLDLKQVAQNFLSKSDWKNKFGIENIWDNYTNKNVTAEQKTSSTTEVASLMSALAMTNNYSTYGSMLNDASTVAL